MKAKSENKKPGVLKRALSCLVSAALAVAFTPVVAWGETGGTSVELDIKQGSITITSTGYKAAGNSNETSYTGSYTIKSTATGAVQNTIKISSGEHDITLSGVNIQFAESASVGNGKCAFEISPGATVNLTLEGTNILTSNGECAGLQVPQGSELIVNGPGSLKATASNNGAGIGGIAGINSGGSGGSVTIKGGTVSAYANVGAGIGGGSGGDNGGSGGSVTIIGGTVVATAWEGAGIGGGFGVITGGAGGSVTISGGVVTASGDSAGIGGGGGYYDLQGSKGADGTFSTGTSGNAVIFASSISDQSGKSSNSWSGVIFENGQGTVYGSPTLTSDLTFPGVENTATANATSLTVPENSTLTIAENTTLTIEQGGTLTNNGTIINKGTITNNGTISNAGRIFVDGTLSGTGTVSGTGAVYYPLSVTGGSAEATNTSTLNDKTYGKAGGTITLSRTNAPSVGYSATWSATPSVDFNGSSFTMPSNALTVTASQAINQYTITFKDGDNTLSSSTQNYGTQVTAPANPTKTGYTFAGWDTEIPATMPAENVTITAQWTINQYTITFDTDGGSEVAPITKNYDSAVTAPENPTKKGYTFAGWSETVPTTMPAEDKTLTAQWTVNQYNVNLNTNGGTIKSGNVTSYTYGVGATLPTAQDISRSGYTFAGWYGNKDFTGEPVKEISADAVDDKEFWAKWNVIYVPPTYDVPVTGEGSIAVKATINGSTAVVAEISAKALESAAGSGATNITIDLSGLPKGVTQAQLSKTTLENLAAVVSAHDNAVESVTIVLGGATLEIDADALSAIAEQAQGANVSLSVVETKADALNGAQKDALSPFTVVQLYFEAQIKSGNAEIHDFGGGSVRVSVAFEPRVGHNPAHYVVLYVSQDGQLERYGCAWANGMLSFMAPHFSAYAVVYVEDATQAAIDALEAVPSVSTLKTSQAKAAVKKAQAALAQVAALDDGQKALVDEALVANAQEVVVKGAVLIAKADKKAVGKVKNKAFSVKVGTSKSIYFKTLVSAAGTKVTYKKASGSSYITVTKAGKVTAKKGMKEDKTYTAKIKVTCGKSWKYVKVTVKVRG